MGVIDEMKDIADLVKKAGDIDLYRRIVNLEGEIIDLTRTKRNLEEQIVEYEKALEYKRKLVFRDGHYWVEGEAVPYCSGCWDGKKTAVHLHRSRADGLGIVMQCPACKHNYPLRQAGV